MHEKFGLETRLYEVVCVATYTTLHLPVHLDCNLRTDQTGQHHINTIDSYSRLKPKTSLDLSFFHLQCLKKHRRSVTSGTQKTGVGIQTQHLTNYLRRYFKLHLGVTCNEVTCLTSQPYFFFISSGKSERESKIPLDHGQK